MHYVPAKDFPNLLVERLGRSDQILDTDSGKLRFAGRPFEGLHRAEHLYGQARDAEHAGDDFRALNLYEEARQLQPQNANLAYCVGVVRQRLDGPGAAIRDYQEALRLEPRLQLAASNLGG